MAKYSNEYVVGIDTNKVLLQLLLAGVADTSIHCCHFNWWQRWDAGGTWHCSCRLSQGSACSVLILGDGSRPPKTNLPQLQKIHKLTLQTTSTVHFCASDPILFNHQHEA